MRLAVDGGKRPKYLCAAWAVVDLDTHETWGGILGPETTSNQAEYWGLISALKIALERNPPDLLIQSDSELMVRHVNGEYSCKHPHLRILLREVRKLMNQLQSCSIIHVGRDNNIDADLEVNRVMDSYLGKV
jgi:ribonuclease HI